MEVTSVWCWGEPANRLESYVHSRSQQVTILGATSSPLPVTSGVPQGSILGPILFLLYVKSLPDVVRSSQIAAFADDTKVLNEITSKRDGEQLQEDLSDLITWSDSASLNFNYSKCKAQRITRKLKARHLCLSYGRLLARSCLHHGSPYVE